MEPRRHILPSNNYPQVSSDLHRPVRQPLGESTGNQQHYTLASSGVYHDQKPSLYHLNHHAPPKYPSLPTLPSQGTHHVASQLGQRRQHIRQIRQHRGSRNPISESIQYQSYRARQAKDADGDQKWSDSLEDAFLEALMVIPKMGRRKFSLNGKPHGRNELISLYLWIAYCDSLPPGVKPDPTMQRTRKQVSSHIQVLKGFLRTHPEYDRLFPAKETPKNGFEDSYKNDPCLRALAMNRLPAQSRQPRFDYVPSMGPTTRSRDPPIAPTLFLMSMTSPKVKEDHDGQRLRDGDAEPVVTHEYCSPPLRTAPRGVLDSIPNWRSKFPQLTQAYNTNDLNCDLIHVDVTLQLREGRMPEGSELLGSFVLHVPCLNDSDLRATWRCKSSLYKPRDLHGSPEADPLYLGRDGIVSVEAYNPGVGSNMRIPFPANPWAHALVKLAEMEAQFHEAQQIGQPGPLISARRYIEQIAMYQEVFSSPTPDGPPRRRAIVLWTFQKSRAGEKGQASWRYLDSSPQRQSIIEPHPPAHHMVSSAMNENYSAYVDMGPQSQMHIQPPPHFSLPGVMTPPLSATHNEMMHGQLSSYNSQYTPQPPYGFQHEMSSIQTQESSFMTNETADSDSTLVDNSQHTISNGPSQGYLASEQVDLGFDGGINNNSLPSIENYEHDSGFYSSFGTAVPSQQGWDVNFQA